MIHSNEQLMKVFINGGGVFADFDNFVNAQDLSALRYHQSASKQAFARAAEAESGFEKKRLMGLYRWHSGKVDCILDKYGV